MNLFDRKTAQVLATILAFAAGLWVLWGLRELFFLFLLAIFFAYTVEPLIAAIYRHTPRQVSRRSSIFATFLVVFLASALTVVFIGQLVVDQAGELIKQLPSLDQDPTTAVSFPLPAQLEPFRNELLNYGLAFARSTANAFVSSLSSTGFLILSPIFALFYLLEGPAYRHSLIQFAARTGHQVWLTGLLEDLRSLLSNYIRALFLQSLSVFLGYLAFYQITQVPYALLLATLAAVLEVIPVLGWISAAILSLIVAAFSGYSHLLAMLVFYIVFRIFQDYVVTPYLMKNGIELPALVVLAGVIGGEMLGGIRGMFLSIPFLATLRILYRHWLKRGAIMLLLGFSLDAHSSSVSTSDAKLDGQAISLHLRMPRYEAEHIPASGLAAAIQFKNANLATSNCAAVDQEILCDLTYQFQNPPAELVEANVTLARVTVPNHVHIMRFTRGPVTKQAVFDRTFENERIDLREVGKVELWWRAARMGFVQLAYQPILIALLLFIGRPIPYTAAAAAAFLVILPDRFYAVPGFFELATAISLSYLALEQIYFPDGAAKWAIFAFIGLLEGTALAILARPTGPGAIAFGAGNLIASLSITLLAARFSRNIPATVMRRLQWAFAALGVIWSIWVFVKRF
jgi:predicted PurR-regulated permease PerM